MIVLLMLNFILLDMVNRNCPKKEQEYALSCWKQAQEFYTGLNNLSILAKPLLAYYSILNTAKTLLICKHKLPQNEHHGLSGE